MDAKRMLRLAMLGQALGFCFLPVVTAAPPWAGLLSVGRIEADPNKTYAVTDANGPYMIMACSFSGPEAEKQAKELVLELRKKHKLEAYLHKVHFKLDDPNGETSANGSPRRRSYQYARFMAHPDRYKDGAIKEVAVMVGNYRAVEDPDTQKTLKTLKSAQPDCLQVEKGKRTSQTLAALRFVQQHVAMEGNQTKGRGPMGHAFVTTNPLLPPDYYAPKGVVDELVLKMNKKVEHSLLDCPGKYTVQVARFTGEVTINQREIAEIQSGLGAKKAKRLPLEEAAEKAHILTEALRLKGYEAYEFHDRYASIVTVGSFDSVGAPRPDGKIEINPKILAIIDFFKAKDPQIPGQPAGAMQLKQLADIYFDMQPMPVEVPKRSISRELARHVEDE